MINPLTAASPDYAMQPNKASPFLAFRPSSRLSVAVGGMLEFTNKINIDGLNDDDAESCFCWEIASPDLGRIEARVPGTVPRTWSYQLI